MFPRTGLYIFSFFWVIGLLLIFNSLHPQQKFDPSQESGATVLGERKDNLDELWNSVAAHHTFWDSPYFSPKHCSHPKSLREQQACAIAWLQAQHLCQGIELPSTQEALWKKTSTQQKEINGESISNIVNTCPLEKRPYVWGQVVNSYLSVAKDPHTYLMPTELFEQLMKKQSPWYGAFYVRKTRHPWGRVSFIHPTRLRSQPALRIGDKVLTIEGEPIPSLHPRQISLWLENRPELHLEIEREEKKIAVRVTQEIQREAVSSFFLDNRVLFTRIERFAFGVCESMENILKSNLPRISTLILDLRENPGGSVEEARCLADLFTPKGIPLFWTTDRRGQIQEAYYSFKDSLYSGPLLILVNTHSASASEIVAGTLQALGRGTVIGQKTFGKGTFQDASTMGKNQKLLIFETQGFYLLPSGKSAQRTGVHPEFSTHCPGCEELLREEDLYLYPIAQPRAKNFRAKKFGAILSQNWVDHDKMCLQKGEDLSFSWDETLNQVLRLAHCINPLSWLENHR